MKKHESFLKFTSTDVHQVMIEGIVWFSLKSLCGIMGVDYTRTFKRVKADLHLSQNIKLCKISIETKQGTAQEYTMTCLPENLVYGFILTTRTKSPAIIVFQRKAYALLYENYKSSFDLPDFIEN